MPEMDDTISGIQTNDNYRRLHMMCDPIDWKVNKLIA